MRRIRENWSIIGRGKCGWHANRPQCSSSGGTLAGYVAESAPGTPVYDANEADYSAFADAIIRGPIPAPELPESMTEQPQDWSIRSGECCTREGCPMRFHAPELPCVRPIDRTTVLRSLDKVPLDAFLARLAEIPGMRIGMTLKGKRVQWDDGTVENFGEGF